MNIGYKGLLYGKGLKKPINKFNIFGRWFNITTLIGVLIFGYKPEIFGNPFVYIVIFLLYLFPWMLMTYFPFLFLQRISFVRVQEFGIDETRIVCYFTQDLNQSKEIGFNEIKSV